MSTNNLWCNSAEYYDIILGRARFGKSANFVASILQRFKCKTILELACGTGLYLRPLKRKRFHVEGLDLSKQMLAQAKKINVPLYHQDMSKFTVSKKYDAILCLNSSLLLVKNLKQIEHTIKQVKNHLQKGGIFIIDLPHHEKEISTEQGIEIQKFTTPKGILNLKSHAYRRGEKWVESWSGQIGKKKFYEQFAEIIYNFVWLRKILQKYQFTVLNIYGSRTGGKFTKSSYRRLIVCKYDN